MRAVVLVVVAACCALLLMDAAQAVDRSKFRTCSQTAFCKRNRDKATAVDKAMTSQDTSDPRYGMFIVPSFDATFARMLVICDIVYER